MLLKVHEATHSESIQPGGLNRARWSAYACGTASQSRAIIFLDTHPEDYLHIPPIDVLMTSVAQAFGNRALGVFMTGMGSDGAAGMNAIHRQGGLTIGQNEATCTVYGMPRACAGLGILTRIVPLPQIPAQILQATRYRRRA